MKKNFWLQPKVFAALAVGFLALAEIIDGTIVTVAIPQMMTSLNTNVDTISMVSTAYFIAAAIFNPIAGLAMKRFSIRKLTILSTILFAVSSILCGMAESLPEMIVFRLAQGIGGSFLPAIAQAYIMKKFFGKQKNTMMLVLGAIIVMGPVIGPIVGAILTQNLNWRYIFYVNVPICLLSLVFVFLFMERDDIINEKIDYISFGFMAIGIGCLQFFIDQGSTQQWFQSMQLIIVFAIAILFLGFFIWRGMLGSSVVNFNLFKKANFVWNNIVMFITSMAITGAVVYFPAMLQQVYGYTIEDSGFLQGPRGLTAMLCAPIIPWIMKFIGAKALMFLGMTGFAISCFMMAGFSIYPNVDYFIYTTILQGFSMMSVFIPALILSTVGVTKEEDGEVAGIYNFSRNFGASMGVSLASTLVFHQMNVSYHDLVKNVSPYATGYTKWVQQLPGVSEQMIVALAKNEIMLQSTLISFIDTFKIFAIILLLFSWLPLILKAPSREKKIVVTFVRLFIHDCFHLIKKLRAGARHYYYGHQQP